jgi:WhiB family redox-sensing transcriptional regulator
VSARHEHTWQDRALCQGMDSTVFFPETGCTTVEAKKVCRRCNVQVQCLDYAETQHLEYGVWGGRLFKPQQHTIVKN